MIKIITRTVFITSILKSMLKEILKERDANRFWKDWNKNSFEYKEYRVNKDFYELVNGELKEKRIV